MTETVAGAVLSAVSRGQCKPDGKAKANITPESQTESEKQVDSDGSPPLSGRAYLCRKRVVNEGVFVLFWTELLFFIDRKSLQNYHQSYNGGIGNVRKSFIKLRFRKP